MYHEGRWLIETEGEATAMADASCRPEVDEQPLGHPAAGETLNFEKPRCRRGQVQRLDTHHGLRFRRRQRPK
jgi:hypothetical protein